MYMYTYNYFLVICTNIIVNIIYATLMLINMCYVLLYLNENKIKYLMYFIRYIYIYIYIYI